MQLGKIHHVAVIGSDYEKSKHFYVELLGFKLLRETVRSEQNDILLHLSLGDTMLELFIKPDCPPRPSYPEAYGLRHLAFEVDSVEETVRELNALCIATEPIRTDPISGGKFTFFSDPDGLPLELHE